MTRSEARVQGLTQYFTGKPCPKGHIANRQVSGSACVVCHNERVALHRINNLAKIRERNRLFQSNYQKEHPEVKRKAQSLRRARFRGAEGSFSVKQIKQLLIDQDFKCTVCLCDLRTSDYQIDHKTPLSRGGSNWIDNIQLLCPNDNRRKNASTDLEYRIKLGLVS